MTTPAVLPKNLTAEQVDLLHEMGVTDEDIARLQAGEKLGHPVKPLAAEAPEPSDDKPKPA